MKKLICILCLALTFSLTACGNKDDKEEPKDDEVKVVINTNDTYTAPIEPTDAQITLYNALSDALEDSNDEEIAKLTAQNFVADFYTLKNKKSSEDIGGLTYLPENRREEFATYASIYAYGNYESITQKYGSKNLPQVKEVEVSAIEAQTISYTDTIAANPSAGTAEQKVTDTYDGYVVSVTLTFESTKVNDLPSTLTVTVIDLDGVYRVISVE